MKEGNKQISNDVFGFVKKISSDIANTTTKIGNSVPVTTYNRKYSRLYSS